MAPSTPVVLQVESAHDFVQYILNKHAPPTTLVVCSPKADFITALQSTDSDSSLWQVSTLRMLSTSRTVKLAFCPDITHLRAYLASRSTDNSTSTDTGLRQSNAMPMLALLDPIQLHRPTSAFSAQGLNRSFAIAVEAARHLDVKLVIAETDATAWDEELSMLNVTTKRLGELSVGRTVKARVVAERWCTFERLHDTNDE
ncbi:hypothetical protein TI39_contig618g00014 [Zymoseptoria brevis]|uniref:Uncharacterized protein n=1 Tax=Zymoseptoria brevis TaxID=1047168 RepID=A0A0F4GK15_9PEZI|nr:hypothetical protein TI39_contig618g00014 [Zymoseptoria brevis]